MCATISGIFYYQTQKLNTGKDEVVRSSVNLSLPENLFLK